MQGITFKTLQNKKACEYRRKSTDDPAKQLFSLEDQKEVNSKTITDLELKISKKSVFEESISAKKRGRPLFNLMMEGLENGDYEVIVCWALNRLARNSVDGALLIELMDEGKLYAIATHGKTYFNTPEDKFMLNLDFGLSKKYSDDLSPTVKRGMLSKVKRGWIPGRPKAGYRNIKIDGEETKQIIDEDRFHLLKDAINLLLEEILPPMRVLEIMNNDWGYRTRNLKSTGNKKLSKSRFYKLLNDPFYHGKLIWGGFEGELHSSVPRLMTEVEYWRIQKILGNRGTPRPQKHLDLPFRGMIKCGECGSTWIPYKKGKKLSNGELKHYAYIKCNCLNHSKTCSQKQTSVEKIENQITKMLDYVTISQDFCDWATKWIKEEHTSESTKQNQILNNLNNLLLDNQNKLNRLVDLQLNGLSIEEYNTKRKELETERKGITLQVKALAGSGDNWREQVINSFNFAVNAKENFEKGDAETKTIILKTLGSNFIITNGMLDITLKQPFVEFKDNHLLTQAELQTIEPNVLVAVSANGDVFEDWILKWSE